MTGATWKRIVLEAATTVSVNPYLMAEIDSPQADTMEAIRVLLEALPEVSEKRIEKALREADEMQIEPATKEFRKLAVRKLKLQTEEELELMDAQILEAAMQFMSQVTLLDISPSYHLHN